MEALKRLSAEREKYNALIEKAGKEAVLEAAKEVFLAHPQINRIEWTQYTPYFNDGDPCEFRVHDVYFLRNAGEDESVDSAEERDNCLEVTLGWGDKRKVLLAKAEEFAGLVDANEDLMETLGEGRVVITRDEGLVVEEYDHD